MGQHDNVVLCGVVQWRHVLLLAAAFQAICASVLIYGFPQLESALRAEGVYAGACNGEATPCDAQLSSLALIFVVGSSLTTCAAIMNGLVMDNYGVKKAALLSNALMLTAFTMLTSAAWTGTEELYLPAFAIMGAGGIGMVHTAYCVSSLFPGHESTVIGIINGFTDGSAVVFLVMGSLYSAGVPLQFLFLAYLLGPLVITSLIAIFLLPDWPFPQQQLPDSPHPESAKAPALEAHSPLKTAPPTIATLPSEGSGSSGTLKEAKADTRTAWATATTEAVAPVPGPETAKSTPEAEAAERARRRKLLQTMSRRSPEVAKQQFPFLQLSIWDQLRSPLFLTFGLFGVTCLFKFNFYLATINAHLSFLGQDSSGVYTTILGISLAVGAMVVPFIGRLVDSMGLHVAVVMLTVLSTALTIVTVIPSLPLQVLGFVILVLFRGAIFTVLAAALAQEFGFPSLGRTLGSVSLVGGLVGLLTQPLFDWSLGANNGDFVPAHLVVGGVGLFQIFFAVGYWRYRARADATGISVALALTTRSIVPLPAAEPKAPAPARTQPTIQMVPV